MKLLKAVPFDSLKPLVGLAVSICLSMSASAQLITYDGFNYNAGSGAAYPGISGLSGGDSTGWGASWSAAGGGPTIGTNVVGGLSYSGLTTDGGSLVVGNPGGPTGTTASPNRNLSGTFGSLAAANGGVLWMSFLYNDLGSTTGAPFLRQANLGLFQGSSEYWDLGLDNTSASVHNNVSLWDGGHGTGTWTGAAPNQSSTAITQGTTFFFVVEFQVDNTAGTADTASVWIDPTIGSPLGSPNLTDTTQDLTGISNVRFQANNFNANGTNAVLQVDEFRLGDSLADVTPTPEPASLALIGIGGLAFLGLMRKRS